MPQRLKDSKNHKGSYDPITPELEEIGRLIVDSAYAVHSNLGPGLLEKVYEVCFCHELSLRNLKFCDSLCLGALVANPSRIINQTQQLVRTDRCCFEKCKGAAEGAVVAVKGYWLISYKF